MSNNNNNDAVKPFPMKSRVILKGLKAIEFNNKVGIITSSHINEEGRQQVHVEELNKTVALKLVNLVYEPRTIESLSVKELKNILRYKSNILKFHGMDKNDLINKLKQELLVSTESDSTDSKEKEEDPMKIADWLAHANAGGGGTATATHDANTTTDNNDVELQQGLQQLDSMSPEMLRQQAQMMKTLPPATIRQMNPQLAHMSDAQIHQAAQQMEMMASNPQMMNSAKEQMKNMTPAQKEQYKQMMGSTATTTNNNSNTTTPTHTNSNPQNILNNMTPEQLQQQASIMKSLSPEQIRQMNPQMKHMSDAQIQQAAQQMEMMASNPELMKMATEQMKNLSPQQINEMMKQAGNDDNNSNNNTINPMMMPGATTTTGGGNGMTMDPAKMLETMDTTQIKQMMNTLKSNPDMIQQLAVQTGMPKEGLEKTLNMFAGMSDEQLESSLKTMAKVQKVTGTVQNIYHKCNTMVGGKLKIILITSIITFCIIFILYLLGGNDDNGTTTTVVSDAATKTANMLKQQQQQQQQEDAVPDIESDEFNDEF